MASGSISWVQEKPPALPVKQHRSHSSRGSSAESDCVESVVFSPAGLQHQNYTYIDVFPEPTDCHADQCPIHQRYDLSRHQMRFFSDGTPPPVPKKRLVRTLSLPGVPPFSPLSPRRPLQMHPQHFDNPLYMLSPIRDTHICEEAPEVHTVLRRNPAVPSLTFSQLSFDTPDEHLPYLFSSFDDLSVVSQGIQYRHLLFLRSMAQRVDSRILLQGEAVGRDVSSYQPREFFLCEGVEPQQVGDTVYYSLHSPRFPGRELGLRLHKPTEEACSTSTKPNPQHVNVQHIAAHFTPSSVLKDSSSTTQTQDCSDVPKSDCTAAKTPCGGSNEYGNYTQSSHVSTVQHLLEKGHSVSVERDLPQATLEDFVEDSSSLQSTDSLLYDKRVCFLLLQILMGAQHLYNNNTPVAELRPRAIFLMWPCKDRGKAKEGENMTEENVSEMHGGLKSERIKSLKEGMWQKAKKMGRIQMLWRTLGSPRVVITCRSDHSEPQPLVSIKAQIGALIQYCLDPQEGQVSLSKSSYRRVLRSLVSQLHRDGSSSGLQMADMVTGLQVLLWGPCWGPQLNPRGSVTPAVHNWLTIKRALLVMKLAEKGLIQDQSVLDWEDCLCLQYLAFTDPEAVVTVTSQLQITE
ncbi:inactive tyrosine-protein kinase PRAG1 [Sphaeramia orbicularis]|uniref:inactive tyrosine-protein kinase PRAG1 n=1 Tax=Sphaeramia orbicularis TaxID=375764 RepID=UPI001181414D|nr:uncharacterized protein PEAK3 [Sphaeramia orbicularis]